MRKIQFWPPVIAAFTLLLAQPASAGYMRCGNHLIEDDLRHGPGQYEVLKKCGEPTERFGHTWIYERAGSRKVVKFDDAGRLQRIEERT